MLSSSGLTYTFVYADGSWRTEYETTGDCFDETGQPTGEVSAVTATATLAPAAPYDPLSAVPLVGLSGTSSSIAPLGCDGTPITYEYSLVVTRTGD